MRAPQWLLACLVLLAGLVPPPLHAAMPPAGTLIENQAEVTYFNEALGVLETVTSNAVRVEVGEYPALTVDFDQTVYLPAGTVSQFGFFVTNTGNVPIEPGLTLAQAGGDDFDLENVAMIADLNGNGIAEPGEPEMVQGAQVELAVGTGIGVIVTFRTPHHVSDSDEGVISLTAEDPAYPAATGSAAGTAIISSSALTLEKAVNRSAAEAGEPLRYTLRLRNQGGIAVAAYDAIDGAPIVIDGNQVAAPGGILVRDEIPLNTHFSGFVQSVNFTPLYHVAGDAEHSYRTAAPADPGTVDAVAWYRSGDYPGSYSADLVFEVATLSNVSRSTVYNTASTWQHVGGGLAELESNTVATPVGDVEGVLSFTDDAFSDIETAPLNTNTRIQISASACNLTGDVDTVEVRISTVPEDDLETVIATETGPNTGVFQTASIPVQAVLPAVQEDGILSGDRASEATARATCNGQRLSDTLVINPGGVVFHALTNEPVPGAEVYIHDLSGTQVDLQVSDADGFYQFAGVTAAGAYTIAVVPPAGYAFPSSRTVFTGFDRTIDAQASYGEQFATSDAFFGIDIPLDPNISDNALVVKKKASRTRAGPGDFFVYTVTIENNQDIGLLGVTLYDTLPSGVALVEDSARLDGQPVAVTGAPGPALSFDIGTVSGQGELELTYIVHVKPTARGKLVNSAYAEGSYYGASEPVQSNVARAVVRVDADGVFDKTGTVLGTVFVDLNGNGVQDGPAAAPGNAPLPYEAVEKGACGADGEDESAGCALGKVVIDRGALAEHGIPGVKIYFENGASVVTDEHGRFSMPGLKAVTHVMAIARRSLPETLEPKVMTTRDALSPYSRFIDVKQGELRVENIVLVPRAGADRAAVLAELELRRSDYASLEKPDNIFWSEDELDLPGERRGRLHGDKASLPTATEIVVQQAKQRQKARERAAAAVGADRSKGVERTADLEAVIRELSPELAFLDLEAEDVLDDDVVTIRVKGPAAGPLGLLVNGEEVSSDHISQRTVFQGGNVQAIEYVAVRLEPGRNDLLLTMSDPFGNVRRKKELTVYAPGKPAKLELIAPPAATADPASPIPVLVRVLDADGLPTYASMDVTLETKGGAKWDVDDIREGEPGVQAYIDGGEAVFDYFPPSTVGTSGTAAGDDEDGVTLPAGGFAPGTSMDITVEASQAGGVLNAWIDWNGDGDWDDAGEQVATDAGMAAGGNTVSVSVPAGLSSGTTFARFRLSTDTGLSYTGTAGDGEVEDYEVTIAGDVDYGDAPNTYLTTDASNGARHTIPASPTLYLGQTPPDADDGTLANAGATADDLDGTSDEDGAVLPDNFIPGETADVSVWVTGSGLLNAWFDWDGSGTFDAGEQVAADQAVSGGATVLNVAVPAGAVPGTTYARFRLCSAAGECAAVTGLASDGEVEDYAIVVGDTMTVSGTMFEDNGAAGGTAHDGTQDAGEAAFADVTVEARDEGTDTLLATTVTDADGAYALALPAGAAGTTVRIAPVPPTTLIAVSENPGTPNGLVNPSTTDGQIVFVPQAGTPVNDVDFGYVRAPTLTLDRTLTMQPGGTVAVPHTYTSHTAGDVTFTLANVVLNPTSAFAGTLYRDADCSAAIDDGEGVVSGPVTVAAGDTVCLLVRVQTATGAAAGSAMEYDLAADTAFFASTVTSQLVNHDVITVTEGVTLDLVKRVRNVTQGVSTFGTANAGGPGDVLEYQVVFANQSSEVAQNVTVHDRTPAWTSLEVGAGAFVAVTPPGMSCAAVTPASQSDGYTGPLEWSCTGDLAPGEQGEVRFQVQIDQ